MKCGHCGTSGSFVSVQHVKACSGYEQMRQTLIKTPREQMVAVAKTFADSIADLTGVYGPWGEVPEPDAEDLADARIAEAEWNR